MYIIPIRIIFLKIFMVLFGCWERHCLKSICTQVFFFPPGIIGPKHSVTLEKFS